LATSHPTASPLEVIEEHAVHPPEFAHHFNDLEQQRLAGTLGMWTFLVTEVMFFGGLFTGYAYYRWKFPEAFIEASHHLDILLGTINTAVLIGSSLTMVLAVQGAQRGNNKQITRFLALTILLAVVFLGIKAVEYHHKWVDHLVPGPHFAFHGHHVDGAQLFYSFYFAMTGMHALHMIIGIGLISVLIWMTRHNYFTPRSYGAIENTGLYWHFVDIVWIFLFPLLYLIGQHQP
jgi:cytochrome c oxidase subunit III